MCQLLDTIYQCQALSDFFNSTVWNKNVFLWFFLEEGVWEGLYEMV